MPYGFGGQLPSIPRSLNDLKLPPNPVNILATMAVVNHTGNGHDENHSPQSPDPSDPSPISTPPMNVSKFNIWETPHTTTHDNTFFRRTNLDAYTEPLPWMKPSIRKPNPDENICCPVHPRRHLLAR